MKETLDSIISECISRNIPVQIVKGSESKVCYEISGFSKSGIAKIYLDKGMIICETRYGTLDQIDSFQELAMIALEWYLNYKERSPFENPEPYWAEYWVEKGIMTKHTKTCYSLR